MEHIPSSINILFSVVSSRSMWLEYTIIAELLRYRTVNLIVNAPISWVMIQQGTVEH